MPLMGAFFKQVLNSALQSFGMDGATVLKSLAVLVFHGERLGMQQDSPFDVHNPVSLEELAQRASVCTRCVLSQSRTQAVFFDGNPQAQVMLVGEGPGQQEDETGIPFVGRAGQLLTKILEAVGIDRKRDVYICNTVKCRPPQNRTPEPAEMEACSPYLEGQLYWVKPKIILLSGGAAVRDVLKLQTGITKIRGQWYETPFNGALAMPIFHPSYLLRNPSKQKGTPKWLMWQDIQEVRRKMDELGIPVSGQAHPSYIQQNQALDNASLSGELAGSTLF
jgi:uracil-DNA glycosylase family 4